MVLIDTWWNVNSMGIGNFFGVLPVLIDTWWNVNVYTRSLVLYLGLVLIDTWWNVNVGDMFKLTMVDVKF